MNEFINAKPAGYSSATQLEIKAVNILNNLLLLSNRIIPHLQSQDKVPNIDGYIIITDENGIELGKLEVQIKTLTKRNNSKPKHQCKKTFLAYCGHSVLPVLLIVVDVDNYVAYWHHIDKLTLSQLSQKMKGKTVNLDFHKDKLIKKDNYLYVEQWIEIVKNLKEKIYDYDFQKERKEEAEQKLNELNKFKHTAIGKKDSIFKEMHIFLDFYNGLLDNDFLTIKELLYPDYWKIGLGILKYSEKTANFLLYPIEYELNDVLIKQYELLDEKINLSKFLKGLFSNRHNPIKEEYKKYSYKLIEEDTERALKNQLLFVNDEFLASEYLLAFIDKLYFILDLDGNAFEYTISEIEFAINVFLPFWIELSIDKTRYKFQGDEYSYYLDHIIRSHHNTKFIQKVCQQVKEKIQNDAKPSMSIKIRSDRFKMPILKQCISYFKQINIDKVYRRYAKTDGPHTLARASWEEENIFKNIKIFFEHFARIYDLLIKTYFPNLVNELRLYNGYNLILVITDFSTSSLNYYCLQSDINIDNHVKIYDSKDENVPLTDKDFDDIFIFGNKNINIDGNDYKRKITGIQQLLNFVCHETPILKSINDLLYKKLKHYLKNKKKLYDIK